MEADNRDHEARSNSTNGVGGDCEVTVRGKDTPPSLSHRAEWSRRVARRGRSAASAARVELRRDQRDASTA
ncbi:hypothetical protein GCM10023169_06510 [Georgenia halophila]|uniref:Uncharacterized protein n=1 Tax=Georgenia halophila TaxID=620889 RepID=A0ABP8KVV8_9MICO